MINREAGVLQSMGSQRIRRDGATEQQDTKNLTLKKSRHQVSDSNSKTVGSSPNLSCRVSLPLVKLWCKIREKYSPLSQKTTKHSFFPQLHLYKVRFCLLTSTKSTYHKRTNTDLRFQYYSMKSDIKEIATVPLSFLFWKIVIFNVIYINMYWLYYWNNHFLKYSILIYNIINIKV